MRTATKLTLAAGLAAGYVLGTRAGRERYEKMKTAARKVADAPAVKQTANVIQVQAYELGRNAASKGKDVVVHVVEVVRERGDHAEAATGPAGSGSASSGSASSR